MERRCPCENPPNTLTPAIPLIKKEVVCGGHTQATPLSFPTHLLNCLGLPMSHLSFFAFKFESSNSWWLKSSSFTQVLHCPLSRRWPFHCCDSSGTVHLLLQDLVVIHQSENFRPTPTGHEKRVNASILKGCFLT